MPALLEIPMPEATTRLLPPDATTRAFRFGPCTVLAGRELGRWHMSIAHPRRLPSYDDIKDARAALERIGALDPDAAMAMPFPPRKWWLSVHQYALHLWQIDDPTMVDLWREEGLAARASNQHLDRRGTTIGMGFADEETEL